VNDIKEKNKKNEKFNIKKKCFSANNFKEKLKIT